MSHCTGNTNKFNRGDYILVGKKKACRGVGMVKKVNIEGENGNASYLIAFKNGSYGWYRNKIRCISVQKYNSTEPITHPLPDLQDEINDETSRIEAERERIAWEQDELERQRKQMNDKELEEAERRRIALQEEAERLRKLEEERKKKQAEIEREKQKLRDQEEEMARRAAEEEKERLKKLKEEERRRRKMLEQQEELEREKRRMAELQKESDAKRQKELEEQMRQIQANDDDVKIELVNHIPIVINDEQRHDFLEISASKKKKFQQLPSLTDIGTDYKEAENLTNKILENKNNSNLNERDTLLNILGNIGQQNGKNVLFFDSKKTKLKSPENNKENELKFTLNLNSFEPAQKIENEVDTVIALKSCIDKKKCHPILSDYKQKLSKIYNVNPDQIKIIDIFSGSINITYIVDIPKNKREEYYKENIQGEQGQITQKMKKQFKEYSDCKIHAILYRESFDINMFSEKGNKTFDSGNTFKVGPKGREKDYIQPTGWVRFGLNVIGNNKYGSDHTWLSPFQHINNWYRCYHGTGSSNNSTTGKSVDVMSWIHNGGFHTAGATAYGPGVYCSPDPIWLEKNYAGTHQLNGKKYKFMLQCGVNPNGVRIYQDKYCGNDWQGGSPWGPIWVAKQPVNIRAYGILIKEC